MDSEIRSFRAPPLRHLTPRQMRLPGGPLSFVVRGGLKGPAQMVDALRLITHAVTFGPSRNVCMHPAAITHEHMTATEEAPAGIEDGLIRLSVGLEDPEHLIADLDQALAGLSRR